MADNPKIENQIAENKADENINSGKFIREIYSCGYCGVDVFSSNYLIENNQDLCFSESLIDTNLLQAKLNGKIFSEVYCPNCNTKLGHLYLDSSQISKKRFNIPKKALVCRKKSIFSKQ